MLQNLYVMDVIINNRREKKKKKKIYIYIYILYICVCLVFFLYGYSDLILPEVLLISPSVHGMQS